jgi:tyrosinase
MSRPLIAEMVGATSASFYIGPGTTQVSLEVHSPTGPARAPEERKQRAVILQVENVTGARRAPPFEVYLNVPAGDAPEQHPELRAGSLGLFGLVESSDPDAGHGGNGMSFTLDVTVLFGRLTARTDWDSRNLRVSFVATEWDAPVPKVRVGRVSLYLL